MQAFCCPFPFQAKRVLPENAMRTQQTSSQPAQTTNASRPRGSVIPLATLLSEGSIVSVNRLEPCISIAFGRPGMEIAPGMLTHVDAVTILPRADRLHKASGITLILRPRTQDTRRMRLRFWRNQNPHPDCFRQWHKTHDCKTSHGRRRAANCGGSSWNGCLTIASSQPRAQCVLSRTAD